MYFVLTSLLTSYIDCESKIKLTTLWHWTMPSALDINELIIPTHCQMGLVHRFHSITLLTEWRSMQWRTACKTIDSLLSIASKCDFHRIGVIGSVANDFSKSFDNGSWPLCNLIWDIKIVRIFFWSSQIHFILNTNLRRLSNVDPRIIQHCKNGAAILRSSWNAWPKALPWSYRTMNVSLINGLDQIKSKLLVCVCVHCRHILNMWEKSMLKIVMCSNYLNCPKWCRSVFPIRKSNIDISINSINKLPLKWPFCCSSGQKFGVVSQSIWTFSK